MKLIKVLENQVQESDSSLFQVRDQIERNLQYYSLQPLGNEQKGRSHYVSPDVHDYVESKKAMFSQTFLSNRQTVKFAAGGNTPEGEAESKTAYVNKILDKNNKERMFHDLWHDAFTAKRAVLMCEWVDDTEDEEINIEQPVPQQALMAQIGSDPSIIDVNTDNADINVIPVPGPNGIPVEQVMLSGQVTITKQAGKFNFTVCQPERYYKDPMASTLDDAMWVTYEDEVPRGTLIRMGYDRDMIESLSGEQKWRTDDVRFSRNAHDGSWVTTNKANRVIDQENINLYKTWTWINLSEVGAEFGEFADETLLYEIHWAEGEILKWANDTYAIRQVEKKPFFEWSELTISHSSNGMCGADVVAHSQKVNSVLKRAIIDNQNIRNNSRFEAVHDLILNPRDLIDNTTGGVIFTEQIGSVAPLPSPELSPVTFNVLEMMKADTEARSGLSSLTKGMNTAVLENQNAKDMVERLTNAAGARPTADARSFAQTFLVPLFRYIVDCAKKYDMSQDQTESGGRLIPVIPSQWQGDYNELDVHVALTPDEAEAHAQKLMTMHQILSMDPVASQLYGVAERHALFDDVFDSLGVSDTTRYMIRPDSPEFQAQSQQVQEMQQVIQQLQEQLNGIQTWAIKQQVEQGWAAINSSIMDKMEDNSRNDLELSVDTRQGDRKLDIDEMKVNKGA